jgi:hypothetical protein
MLVQNKRESCQEANTLSLTTISPPNLGGVKQYLQKLKVDSLKLRIEIEKVQFVSSTFCEKYQKIYVTGELDEEFNLEKHKTSISKGITTRIGIVSCMTGKDQMREFVYFQVNSKMCKGDYLKGITEETIRQVYDYIISQEVVFMTYDDFINGYVTDIDFAYDVEISPDNMKKLNSRIYSKVREDKYKYVDKPFGKQENIGIQFNKRDKATPTTPFIKIYHKGIEFQYHSNEFYNEFLSPLNLNNYGRLEYTLKNAKHQKHLGIEIKTLNQLLKADSNVIEGIVLSGISENYIEKRIVVRDYTKLSPTDRLILHLISEVIERGGDKSAIYGILSSFNVEVVSDRRDKSRVKKLLDDLMERVEVGDKKKMVMNEEINSILSLFNLS